MTLAHESDLHSAPAAWVFPPDRLYADGHLWVQIKSAGCVRTGIDACAARLLAEIQGLTCAEAGRHVDRGDALCELQCDGGSLVLPAPVCGELVGWNARAIDEPQSLAADPYGVWIAEIAMKDDEQLHAMLHADAAVVKAHLSARQFARHVALGLLSLPAPEVTWMNPALVAATRKSVGASLYMSMVRDMLL